MVLRQSHDTAPAGTGPARRHARHHNGPNRILHAQHGLLRGNECVPRQADPSVRCLVSRQADRPHPGRLLHRLDSEARVNVHWCASSVIDGSTLRVSRQLVIQALCHVRPRGRVSHVRLQDRHYVRNGKAPREAMGTAFAQCTALTHVLLLSSSIRSGAGAAVGKTSSPCVSWYTLSSARSPCASCATLPGSCEASVAEWGPSYSS